MAGIAIPDNVRPVLAAVAKYHFWILAALVPLVLVPLLFLGTGNLRAAIATQRRQIESKLGQARKVTAVQPHPNEGWRTAIDADTEAVRRETLEEWQRFWHSQAGLRIWPAELGQQFLDAIAALEPGGKLDRNSLIQYENTAPRLAQALPARMGVADLMVGGAAAGAATPRAAGPGPSARGPALAWAAESQKRIHASFEWSRVPNTTQVLLAQEELWVYGVFCDLLARFVRDSGATGAHDSPLTLVEDLVVGFPTLALSNADTPRIFVDKAAPGADPGLGGEAAPPADGTGPAPWHPRFSGDARPAPADGQPPGAADDAYRGWIYVDIAGKPLSVEELAAAPAMRMVHLMPFVLRVTMDQRQIDRLLAAIAVAPIPIDVREVRVNPGAGKAAQDRAPGRPNDLTVELRGSVALATRPETAPAPAAGAEVAP